jgi:hypothetical protein
MKRHEKGHSSFDRSWVYLLQVGTISWVGGTGPMRGQDL